MSGAPLGRYFEVDLPNGDGSTHLHRYTVLPKVMSEQTLNQLRQVLLRRRRENRQQTIQDFALFGKDLPAEAQAAFAKEILASAKEDTGVGAREVIELLGQSDSEAVAVVLWSCSPEIHSFEEAKKIIQAHGRLTELVNLINDVLMEEADSLGNSDLHPEKA